MPSVTPQTTTLLLVDDHEVVLRGLRSVLSQESGFEVVGEARTASDAVAKACQLKPDVVLLDVRIPDNEGISVCAKILEGSPETRVIFLTSYADEETVMAALLAGADGYLLKDVGTETLIRSIRIVTSGQSILDPAITKQAFRWMKTLPSPSGEGSLESLSPQEKAVLALVAEGKTNKEIAASLGLSDKTVKNYL
ncbi:MAG: response regulator transcription factor, partial [Nitrospirota bacterium]